jgi:hypothetical protein
MMLLDAPRRVSSVQIIFFVSSSFYLSLLVLAKLFPGKKVCSLFVSKLLLWGRLGWLNVKEETFGKSP